ncbi:serine/threonine-protein phosphatase [Schaalia sp. ZJ405]|uniref:PP2C family protein-serine/threonine phosphatase n=1 Tax=Schaalia sp. ZJ405 TaxID=2709403 RepID=UPI0013EDC513|nr:protein phosphatase 2C domain-containing protein [Schaalia sp. ZJ405]QPK81528.1 serine/threonine-protein phosphatase [Schaalia sp. ZJ405]
MESRLDTSLSIDWGAATDAGPVRTENQDSWLSAPPFFVVADGMGGHAGGAQASAVAVHTLGSVMTSAFRGERRLDVTDLDAAIEAAGHAVAELADPDDPSNSPGTTVTGVLALNTSEHPYWLTFNIGDSRTYVVGGGAIRQITKDHTAIQEAKDLMEATHTQLAVPSAHVVTRALGGGLPGSPQADYAVVPIVDGDVAILCTDGVHGVLSDDDLHRAATSGDSPADIAHFLVQAALGAGTRDNASALVVRATTQQHVGNSRPITERLVQAVRPRVTGRE